MNAAELTPEAIAGVLRRAGFSKARHLGPWSTGGFFIQANFGSPDAVFVAYDLRELPGRPVQDPAEMDRFQGEYTQCLRSAGWHVEAVPHLSGLVVTPAEAHAWDTAPGRYEL